jgi:hypothetical protein
MSQPETRQKRTCCPADFAARLFSSETYQEIAESLGVDRKTVAEWAKDPAILAEVEDMRAEVRSRIVNRTAKLATRAINVHAEIMDNEEAPEAVRLAAAKNILDRFAPAATVSEVKVTGALDLGRTDDEDLEARARTLAAAVLGEVEKPPRVEDGGETPEPESP